VRWWRDRKTSGGLVELSLWRSRVINGVCAPKNPPQHEIGHVKLFCEFLQGDARCQRLPQLLQICRREPSSPSRRIKTSSNFIGLIDVSDVFSKFQRFGPSGIPGLDGAFLKAVRAKRFHSLLRCGREVRIYESSSGRQTLTFRTSSRMSFANCRAQRLRSHLHCTFASSITQSLLTECLLSLANKNHSLFGRDLCPPLTAELTTFFECKGALQSRFSFVVSARCAAIEFIYPLYFSSIGGSLAKNNTDDLAAKSIRSELSNGACESGVRSIATFVFPASQHRSLGRVRVPALDITKVVYDLSHVLLPLGGSLSAPPRIGVARVDVDGEPSLLRISAQGRHLPTHLDIAPKRLQNPHRSPSLKGGPRCLGGGTPQAAFLPRPTRASQVTHA
jgi:hypothetical protein